MKINTSSFALALVLALAAGTGAALAQGGAPQSLEAYRSASGSEDMSLAALRHALGDYLDNPLSQLGTPSTLVGRLMLIFNTFVFAAAIVWLSYSLIRHVVSTASSGQLLGQGTPLAGAWLPIRYITGVASLVPAFGGLNLAQALMIWCAGLGIGLANVMWSGAIEVASSFEELVKPPVFSPRASPSAEEAAGALFTAHVCAIEAEREQARSTSFGAPPLPLDRFRTWRLERGAIDSVFFGSRAYPRACGGVALVRSDDARSASSMFGFRVASVDYEAVASVAQVAHLGQFQSLKTRVAELAARYVAERDQPRRSEMPAVPLAEIREIARAYSAGAGQRIEAQLAGAHRQAITDSAREQMSRHGWAAAGAWYSTFAEANAALADAARSVDFAIVWPQPRPGMPGFGGLSTEADVVEQLRNAWARAEASDAQSVGEGSDGAWARLKRYVGRQLGIETPTGNWSLGQSIVNSITGGVTSGTGGGDLVNPITAAKNVGDHLMVMGQAMLIAPAEALLDKAASTAQARGAAMSLGGPVGKAGGLAVGAVGQGLEGLSQIVRPLAVGLLVIGAILSLYIPLIPFITWFAGLVQYACVVGEAIVAAPLWALAHMDSAGDDGLGGPRTARGYLYILNVVFRPALMLFGFFLASALAVGLGTVLVVLFVPALANAQGNSITGLVSVLGFVAIFGVLLVLLVQQLFNLIHLLPDQVLGWIGDGMGTSLGRDSEDRARGAFIAQMRGADAAARPSGGSAAGGAAGLARKAAGAALTKAP